MVDAELALRALLKTEKELNTLPPSIERNAKVTLLKYFQVRTVKQYEAVSDALYFDLQRDDGFDQLYRVQEKPQPEGGLVQPMEMGSIEDYLRQAERAKLCLDDFL